MEPQISRNRERLVNGRENLIYLPLKDEGYPNIPMFLINAFNPLLYAQNHRIVGIAEQFFKSLGPTQQKAFKRGTHPISLVRPDQVTGIVEAIKNSHNSSVTLKNIIDADGMDDLDFDELHGALDGQLQVANGRTCVLSTSHVTDFHLIDSLEQKGVDLSKVGIIVVDQHIDGGSTHNPDGQFTLDKSNFLVPILDRGIGAVSIIGIDEEDIPRIKKEVPTIIAPPDGEPADSLQGVRDGLKKLQDFYETYKDRVNLAPGMFGESRRMSKPKKVLEYVRKQIEFMKSKGIEQIMISFDMDSLDMIKEKVTSPPYNPYSVLLLLGMQDFNQILFAAGVSDREFEDQVRHLLQLRMEINALGQIKKKKGTLNVRENNLLESKNKQYGSYASSVFPIIDQVEAALQSLTCPASTNNFLDVFLESFRGVHVITSDEGGFTVDQAELLIDAIKAEVQTQGMQNGVQLKNGRVMGSVSEIDGPDMDGLSAKAALRLINAISS